MQCDVKKCEKVAIFKHGGHSNQEKSTINDLIFGHFVSIADCLRSFISAQRSHPKFLKFGQNSFLHSNNNKIVLKSCWPVVKGVIQPENRLYRLAIAGIKIFTGESEAKEGNFLIS